MEELWYIMWKIKSIVFQFYFYYSEQCIVDDVNEKTGIVTLSFTMFGKDGYHKSIKDIQVHFSFLLIIIRIFVLRMIQLLIIGFMVFAIH